MTSPRADTRPRRDEQEATSGPTAPRAVHVIILLALVLASIPPFFMAHRSHGRLNDDVYITLTYAKNLAEGDGFIYNHPPPSYGTTTPLTALIMGVVGAVLPAGLGVAAPYFTALFWVGTAWLVVGFRKGFGLALWESAIIAFVLLANTRQYMGGENALFMFLLVLSVALLSLRYWLLSGLAAGLLFLARGEGALMGPVLVASAWVALYTGDKPSVMGLVKPAAWITIGFFAIALAWFFYAWVTFGTIIPNTLHVKMVQGRTMGLPDGLFHEALLRAAAHQWGVATFPFFPKTRAILWLLCGVGILEAFRSRRWFLPILSWTAIYALAYTALQVPGNYGWYRLPIHWTWCLLIGLGLVAVLRLVPAWVRGQGYGKWGVPATACFVLVVLAFWYAGHVRAVVHGGGDPRADSFRAVADYLNEHAEPAESIMTMDVGFLGFYTENRIIDAAALTDMRNFTVPEGEYWSTLPFDDLARERRPDYYLHVYLSPEGEVEPTLELGGVEYVMVAQYPGHRPGMVLPLYIRGDKLTGADGSKAG